MCLHTKARAALSASSSDSKDSPDKALISFPDLSSMTATNHLSPFVRVTQQLSSALQRSRCSVVIMLIRTFPQKNSSGVACDGGKIPLKADCMRKTPPHLFRARIPSAWPRCTCAGAHAAAPSHPGRKNPGVHLHGGVFQNFNSS